jgi:hypothetical protein
LSFINPSNDKQVSAMPMPNLGSLRSDTPDGDVVSLELRRVETEQRNIQDNTAEGSAVLAQTDRDQLARDIADIERATAALRRAEPGLESWTNPTAPALHTPHPLWLLIGLLWLSTALVTAGAVVAIATLAG